MCLVSCRESRLALDHHSVFCRTLFWMLLGFFRRTIHIIIAVAVDKEYLMRL